MSRRINPFAPASTPSSQSPRIAIRGQFLPVIALPLLAALLCLAQLARADVPPPPPSTQPSKLTLGWTDTPFTYEVQHPYDLPLKSRYSYDKQTDTHDLWVFSTDKPHLPPPNRTTARTEIAMERYSKGLHMFDADYFIKPGTFACIMQLFRGNSGPGLMLVVSPEGKLSILDSNKPLADNVYNHWFNLKVMHNPAIRNGVSIYVDDVLKTTYNLKPSKAYYFKCGVYSREKSDRSEVLIHDLTYWVKSPAK